MKKQRLSNDLTQIPYVGNSIANNFNSIGITKISDLKGKNPEALYSTFCATKGHQIDRCLLYVCRSSVYFAENKNPDPEKLKWWNWKDKKV
jgi:hypothetical protein